MPSSATPFGSLPLLRIRKVSAIRASVGVSAGDSPACICDQAERQLLLVVHPTGAVHVVGLQFGSYFASQFSTPARMNPSPHIALRQPNTHASVFDVLPSSHDSPVLTTPLPQLGQRHCALHPGVASSHCS